MMSVETLLQWHYLIFLLPLAVGALLLRSGPAQHTGSEPTGMH